MTSSVCIGLEENLRRAMIFSRGDLGILVERPISAALLLIAVLLIAAQLIFHLDKLRIASNIPIPTTDSP